MAEAVSAGGDRSCAPPDATDSFPDEEELECKICYNYFDLDLHTPKLLRCSHTFCQDCLDALYSREGRGWRIGCPVCRHRTPVPEYRVHKLPNNRALTEALPLHSHGSVNSSNTDVPPAPAVSARERSDVSCQTCKHVALASGCACTVLSLLSTVLLLFLGLIFVHNLSSTAPLAGPVCLFAASVLALFSLIFTWLMCMLRYRPETEASSFSSLTYVM